MAQTGNAWREKLAIDETGPTGARFKFGENWMRFLSVLDARRIDEATTALRDKLGVESLRGKTFLDIGSGSGLSSLAARRLGARVVSFDYDPRSVACTRELKRRFFADDSLWRIDQASALDAAYLEGLGKFDVVYSWGVLHHTGAMWVAIEHAIDRVAAGGVIFIAIYNDQGWKSHLWWFIKLAYNRLPQWLRTPYVYLITALTRVGVIVKYTLRLQPLKGIRSMFGDARSRGMSAKFDRVDWIGGFPYEFATFESLIDYFSARGFEVTHSTRNTSHGCHELVFQSRACAA